jgi:thiosulfate/3-mercaptopyruvate sulfurtransferase
MEAAPLLVTAAFLQEHIHDPQLRLIDTRYYLDGGDPLEEYAAAHLPGAVYMDMERDLTGHPGVGSGRHPLPTAREFQAAARDAGIAMDSHVVVYSNSFSAARLWWMLRYFGFDRVSLLDGGLAGWPGPLESGPPVAPAPGDFAVRAQHDEWLTDFDEVTSLPSDALLLDARGPDRFAGEAAPGDPYAGHIPGARSAHWEAVGLAADGRFVDADELRQRLAAVGLDAGSRAIAYCGSGVQACQLIFTTILAGYPAPRLYVGSWSEYSRRVPRAA